MKNTIEELYQMKQNGQIGWCELALRSDYSKEYIRWCDDHGLEPDNNNAELFMEQTENRIYEDGDEYEPELAETLV